MMIPIYPQGRLHIEKVSTNMIIFLGITYINTKTTTNTIK
ncbi:hypothetical protein AZO1586I_1882 [Bathymodiolus thermophilus thioautotrophic gill symbiont]|uniref:Uncharacterized protein n=1 Tax=Bathymodiolus thermophilus thioautotrophic gill symbiont TaxID=2360 RepID=A0ABM8MA11_9GAMM|nr:hypothetical protein AZO1586I_1882 [Bathymodiolus thermophilus thioautotrophic gill symbiont]CAC9530066.1 hypothetical protein [uncultured Gammaproteobacteria bacterium]